MAAKPRSRPGPGRPSTGARERILGAALEVLMRDGYAGLTTAKVAVASGQNKALISYHFGSKQGLVAEVVEGIVAGVWRVMEHDEGIQRVYFDLASQSVVEPEVRAILAEVNRASAGSSAPS